ncbi:MAG TPA: tetratricopeptide repeat protein [Telluria sp.]|jgi:LSD1 subclass zinc finger protein
MTAQLDTLICKGCGARLSYAAGLQALQCEYCDTVTQIARAAPAAAGTAAQLLVPMTLDDNVLAYAVLQHLAANDQVPDDMVERAVLSAKRFYMPCFAFTGSYAATWTASFGYNRTETYTDHVDRLGDGKHERVPVTKNRTVVDWRPVSGQDAGNFALLSYGGSGLAPSVLPLLERVRNAPTATPFDVSYVSGIDTQPYTLAAKDTYALHTEAQIGRLVEASVKRHGQGDQQRDWHWNASSRWDAAAVYVPVGHVVLEYGGRQYNVWVDGTNAANLVTDALPGNRVKGSHIARGMILPIIALVALVLTGLASNSFFYEMKMERVGAVAALWFLSAWRERRRARRSRQVRQAALAKRAVRYAQAAATPAPEAPGGGFDWVSLIMSLVSTVIVCVLLYKLSTDPGAPSEAVAAPAAVAAGAAKASAPPAPLPPLPPVMAAANVQDWAAVRTLTAKTERPAPVPKAAKAASAAAFSRGAKALLNKDNAAAITAFQAAIEANGANMDARSKLGAAYIGAGDHERAHEVLGELLAAAPGHVEGWRNMAEAAALSNRPAEADASLRMLLHLSKDRKRTSTALRKRAATGEPDQFGEAVARVVKPGAKKAVK